MKPEIRHGVPEADYHADDTTLSASSAKTLLGKRPPVVSEAMDFGTLVHVAILEPDRLDLYVTLDPASVGLKANGEPADNPLATKAWKEAVAAAEATGKRVLPPGQMTKALAMRDAAYAHATARRLIDQATDTELSLYADHPTGARVRGRLDLAGPVIADIKSTVDANPAKFGKRAHDLGYHISAANYLDCATACGLEPLAFAFINIERDPTPGGDHRVSVIELSARAIDLGRDLMTEACRRWLALGKRIDLPTYGDAFNTVDLPRYAYDDLPASVPADDDIWKEAS